jgi:hypothetical protein
LPESNALARVLRLDGEFVVSIVRQSGARNPNGGIGYKLETVEENTVAGAAMPNALNTQLAGGGGCDHGTKGSVIVGGRQGAPIKGIARGDWD